MISSTDIAQSAGVSAHQTAADALTRTADSLRLVLLERDLSAMSAWANWLGAAVGALGVLFASGAIAAAFLLWRQSREYREAIDTELKKYRDTFDSLLTKFREDADQSISALRTREQELNAEFTTAGDERKKVLQRELDEIRAQRMNAQKSISEIAAEALADVRNARRHHFSTSARMRAEEEHADWRRVLEQDERDRSEWRLASAMDAASKAEEHDAFVRAQRPAMPRPYAEDPRSFQCSRCQRVLAASDLRQDAESPRTRRGLCRFCGGEANQIS